MPTAKINADSNCFRQIVRRSMSQVLPRRLFRTAGRAQDRCIFLTFDDGPHPDHTPALLRVLSEHDAFATFFVVGQSAASHPELIHEIVSRGHSIGHHSYYHCDPDTTSATQLLRELNKTNAILRPIIGYSPFLFRPPYGQLTASKMAILWLNGYSIVLWNTDPRDFMCSSADQLENWFQDRPCDSGDIVLFHDTYPFATDVVPGLIDRGKRLGLRFCSIPQVGSGRVLQKSR